MKMFQSTALITLATLMFLLTACETEGPAGQAGENVDQAAEEIQEKADAAGDKAMGTLEQAGDKIEEATDSSAP
jgi:predicted small secreted protein